MNFKNLIYSIEDGICTIVINRPDKLNALNIETIAELKQAFKAANGDREIFGIILTGSGPKAFAAGADIVEFANFSSEEAEIMAENGNATFDEIESSLKPVIAAVNGYALGGGCELSMACHIRIATTNAKFGQPEINLGIIPGYGGTQRLVRLVGLGKAAEMLLTGEAVSAEEAKIMGLVNYVVDAEQLIPKATEIIAKISKKSPLVVQQILKLVHLYYDKNVDGFAEESNEFAECFDTGDFKEGVNAFIEKRKAVFSGQ